MNSPYKRISKGGLNMTKEELIKAREIIIESLNNSNLDIVTLTELMINLNIFLDPMLYEENIKILQRKKVK